MTLPRRLTAVPQDWPVRMEIAKAIRALAAQVGEKEQRGHRGEVSAKVHVNDLLAEAIREFRKELCKAGFRPDQPRWPKRSGRRSGRWSGGAGIAAGRTISAALRGGHHYAPRAIFAKEPLKPETRRVFEQAVTGPLSPGEHGWNVEHSEYNRAVYSASKAFLKRLDIDASEITPDQAKKFSDEIIHSNNAIISSFNAPLRR